jgi:hypothetical protein
VQIECHNSRLPRVRKDCNRKQTKHLSIVHYRMCKQYTRKIAKNNRVYFTARETPKSIVRGYICGVVIPETSLNNPKSSYGDKLTRKEKPAILLGKTCWHCIGSKTANVAHDSNQVHTTNPCYDI